MQGAMTPQQARERFAMLQASSSRPFQEQTIPQQLPPGFPAGGMASGTTQPQMATISQRTQVSTNNQVNPLQRVIQAPDSRQFGMLLTQNQQPQNGSSFASRVAQNLNPPGMGLPQGQGSLQNFVQPSSSVPSANVQRSPAPSVSQAPPPGGQQVPGPPSNPADMPLPQLRGLFNQLMRAMVEGDKSLQALSSTGTEGEMQQHRLKLELTKQRLHVLQELINAKTRAR